MTHRAAPTIPPRLEPCAWYQCRRGGTWRIFTPTERLYACGTHLAGVIVQSGAPHAAVEVVTDHHALAIGA